MAYIEKCLKNYFKNKFTVEQSLYLFSFLINRGIAWSLTDEVAQTANNFIENRWIAENGMILITSDEANEFVENL